MIHVLSSSFLTHGLSVINTLCYLNPWETCCRCLILAVHVKAEGEFLTLEIFCFCTNWIHSPVTCLSTVALFLLKPAKLFIRLELSAWQIIPVRALSLCHWMTVILHLPCSWHLQYLLLFWTGNTEWGDLWFAPHS